MKAYIYQSVYCPHCDFPMMNESSHDGKSKVIMCNNAVCDLFEVVYKRPQIELEPIGELEKKKHDLDHELLHGRAYNILTGRGITTIEDLTRKTPGQLMRMKGMGDKSFNDIRAFLQLHGYEYSSLTGRPTKIGSSQSLLA